MNTDNSAHCYVQNAVFDEIAVEISFSENGREALIDSSVITGRNALGDVDIMETSSYGVGQMIAFAVDYGAKNITLKIGPACTADCGLGMLAALGACFYNKNGVSFVPTGKTLKDIMDFDFSMMYPRLIGAKFEGIYESNDNSPVDGIDYIQQLINQKLEKNFAVEPGMNAGGGLGFALRTGLEGNLSVYQS